MRAAWTNWTNCTNWTNWTKLIRTGVAFTLLWGTLVTAPATAFADGKPWVGWVDGRYVQRGLGFLREFREPGACKENIDELAGAMTSLSPETWGAALGLALGAAAGAASTGSIFGALRGGILLGSIGSALGHLADVLLPERVADLADNLQDLIQERDDKVCQLLRASDKLREPVVEHLEAALGRACHMPPDEVSGAGSAVDRCVRDDPEAARILKQHLSVLTTINQGTCKVAAALVQRFERVIDDKRAAEAPNGRVPAPALLPSCDDPVSREAPPLATDSADAERPPREQIL